MAGTVNAIQLDALPALPPEGALKPKAGEVKVILGDKTLKVHVVQAIPSNSQTNNALAVLFLHGGKFSSQDWLDIKSLEQVANWGFRAVAIDLPGKGKTTDTIEHSQTADFLAAFVAAMELKNLVVVSPSMSGRYSLPFLFSEPKASTHPAVGFVPVAPVISHKFRSQYVNSQLSTLVVFGANDPAGETTLNDFKLLPKHNVASLEGAGHACYLDKPEAFHKVLRHFLIDLPDQLN